MSIETLRDKLHSIVNEIEDEATLNVLMEDAVVYLATKNTASDSLSLEQWKTIEKAQTQIANGQYKSYEEVKQHFSQWLTK
jgi:hypothetical protein